MEEQLIREALQYHREPTPGKISVTPRKSLSNQHDLALAYSPGVAAACNAIAADPAEASSLTSRANLVAVVTNGTAVLGLGNIGPLAGKPVMEGKGCLFKKFAGIDVFDIELAEHDVDKLVDIVAALEPTFGGINLEDIKAPECFEIERRLRERMKIPVFHDDQHGTAIISAAAILNGLRLVGKDLSAVRIVCSGAGAAAIACLDLLVHMGARGENILVLDSKGVLHAGRTGLDASKQRYVRDTPARTLADAVVAADIFLGVSSAGVLKPEMVKTMGPSPLILALANPEPEIRPELAKGVRPDAIVATGRSDYPNQVNNVLCFPFIFRGALDVGATSITDEMKLACVKAIAELAHAEQSEVVALAYGDQSLSFGPEYIIPKPFDPRLITRIAPAVAEAAMQSGVATRPIADLDAYRQRLNEFVYHSGIIMKPVFALAKHGPKRVVYCEGEDERILRAVRVAIDEKLAHPVVIGRPEVVQSRIDRLGLGISAGRDFEIVNPESDERYRDVWTAYASMAGRRGVTPDIAREDVRARTTLIGAMLVHRGDADGLICGVTGRYRTHLADLDRVIGRGPGKPIYAAMNLLVTGNNTLFICDTYVNLDPTAEQVAEMTLMAAEEVQRFGVAPRVALLSHSNFGSEDDPWADKMARARDMLWERAPELEVDGEMHGDAALSPEIRERVFPTSRLSGVANLLIMPNLSAANIAFNLIKVTNEGWTVGPMLLGAAKPVHILTPSATVRRIVNMTALVSVDASARAG